MLPKDYQEVDFTMCNLDNKIADGFEEAIVGKKVFGRHSAWNFNGLVYHVGEEFHEDVWRHREYVETKSAKTLVDLMEKINAVYGWE